MSDATELGLLSLETEGGYFLIVGPTSLDDAMKTSSLLAESGPIETVKRYEMNWSSLLPVD